MEFPVEMEGLQLVAWMAMRFSVIALLFFMLVASTPKAIAWDWDVHFKIAVAAGLPRTAAHGISFPDMMRKMDPKESIRHYMNEDFFPPGYVLGGLPITYQTFAAQVTQTEKMGLLLYEILYFMDLYRKELSAGKGGDFYDAQLRLAHYVGDLYMPLHLTRNHDGEDTGQKGAHERVEDYSDSIVKPFKVTSKPTFSTDEEFWIALQSEAAANRQIAAKLLAIDQKALACAKYRECFKEARPILEKQFQRGAVFLHRVLAYAEKTHPGANRAHYEHRH